MKYKYITDNNLEEKQTYMYSEFSGMNFLETYMESRENIIENEETLLKNGEKARNHVTSRELVDLLQNLCGDSAIENKALIDAYVKSFEVRKRLYNEYSLDWKPVSNADYHYMDNYLLLCKCVIKMYNVTKCAKYLNCLLKLDDTLLSVKNKLTDMQILELVDICKTERIFVKEMANKMGVDGL